MSWLSVAALVWCGVAFFLAAERAYALRKGGAIGRALLAVAAVSYVAVLVVLVQYGLGAGFEKFLAASVAAVSGLACFWFVKIHVDHKRPAAALIATGLGLAMFGVSFLTMVGNLEGRAPRVVDQLPDDPNARLEAQLARLDERKRQLDERLLGGIPEFRSKLRRQAGEVKRQIERASDSAKVGLESELREIAKMLLAIDKEEQETNNLIVRVEQEKRRLERLRGSTKYLGKGDQLEEELDAIWQEAGVQISKPLDATLDGGAVEAVKVQQKMQELMGQ